MATVERALDLIPDGASIVSAPGCGAPTTLLAGLQHRCAGRGWSLHTGLLLGELAFSEAVRAGELDYVTWHAYGKGAEILAAGHGDHVAIRASQVPGHLRRMRPGAAIVRVTPPDGAGNCSLGPSASYGMAALESASVRIAEVDPRLPRTTGNSSVPFELFDATVEAGLERAEYRSTAPSEVARRIASIVLELLPLRPTLQLGIGAVPEFIVSCLADADLGGVRFVGMATDAMVDIFDAAIDKRPATLPPVFSPELMGTDHLLTFADGNPHVGVYTSDVAHASHRLALLDRFVSVNSAVEIDLLGQVNVEHIGARRVSSIGGSLDFVEAAMHSEGGMRILALPSTSSRGEHSKIVPRLTVPVSAPSTAVDYVVTEYGSTRLRGLTDRARAEALIAIAHPAHRRDLASTLGGGTRQPVPPPAADAPALHSDRSQDRALANRVED